ncbi:MAG: sugar ABC transporter permease, partial [Bifidobacterium sp.]|nr:sugar ABC transporter permease [Bifidobacterium sp.]
LFTSMFVTIWLGLGYYMVIYLTALANIDASLYEAASLDGAGPVRQFLYVTIPGVRSTIVLIMMLSTIAAFRVFNEIYVLTNGTAGPGGEDITMSMLIQKEGTGIQARTGYASALSLIVLVVVGAMLILQQIIQKRGEDS